jgi:hypothetical protein
LSERKCERKKIIFMKMIKCAEGSFKGKPLLIKRGRKCNTIFRGKKVRHIHTEIDRKRER